MMASAMKVSEDVGSKQAPQHPSSISPIIFCLRPMSPFVREATPGKTEGFLTFRVLAEISF